MIESPVLQQLKAEWTREAAQNAVRHAIIRFLAARFGSEADHVSKRLDLIHDDAVLEELTDLSGTCTDLESFIAGLSRGLEKTEASPSSGAGKRRKKSTVTTK